MAQVLPAERDLRRVIGDGDGVPDGEVDGLDRPRPRRALPRDRPAAHLRRALRRLPPPGPHRHVRDLLEPRGDAGRLGLRARATTTGSSRATASRRSGSCAGCRPRPSSPGGAAIPRAGGTRLTTTSRRSASRSRPTSRTRPASPGGRGCAARRRVAIAYFGDGATSEGAFHEGANFAAVMRRRSFLFCNNNRWAISTPLEAQTARRDARRQGGRLRDARRCAWTAATSLPSTRRRGRRSSARGRARARRSSRPSPTARRRTRPPTTRRRTSTSSASRRRSGASAWAATSATCGALGVLDRRAGRVDPRRGGSSRCATGSRPPRPSRRRTRRSLFEHALANPPARSTRSSPSCGGFSAVS